MKTRNTMKAKLLLPLLLALLAAPAQANDGVFAMFAPAIGKLAQFSPEERRAMRERWEQAGPEERLQIRREFQDRLRQSPADSRREAVEPGRNPPSSERDRQRGQRQNNRYRGENPDEASFGFGFERRRHEDDRVESPPPGNMPNPGYFFDRRNNRENNRENNRDGSRDGNRPRYNPE
jgi:hypothetical protein